MHLPNVKHIVVILLFMPLMSFTTMHKYYVSLTQVEFVEEKKSLQFTMNVFIDDIERALEEHNKDLYFKLNTPEQLEDSDLYIEAYLKKRFKVEVNGKIMAYNYLGHKFEGDVVFFYIEIESVNSVTSISIENQVLFDTIAEQQNLVKLKINKTFKSLMLTIDNNKGLLNF